MTALDPTYAEYARRVWNKFMWYNDDVQIDGTSLPHTPDAFDSSFLPAFEAGIDNPYIGAQGVHDMIDYLIGLADAGTSGKVINLHFDTNVPGTVDVNDPGQRAEAPPTIRWRSPSKGQVSVETNVRGGMRTFAPGLSIGVSAPTTYTMQYLNGAVTYTEQFVLLRFEAFYVAAAGASVAAAVTAVAAQVATIPVIGPALATLVTLGSAWYAKASLDADGSLTAEFAHHYCGTKAGGIDLTAWPLPGVNPQAWDASVDGMAQFATQTS